MPKILRTVDEIADEKNRDVMLFDFLDLQAAKMKVQLLEENEQEDSELEQRINVFETYLQVNNIDWDWEWRTNPIRQEIIKVLDEHQVPWEDAYPPYSLDWIVYPYFGSIYIDIPYEPDSPIMQRLCSIFENSDGTMKLPGVRWWYFKLENMQKLWEKRKKQNEEFENEEFEL